MRFDDGVNNGDDGDGDGDGGGNFVESNDDRRYSDDDAQGLTCEQCKNGHSRCSSIFDRPSLSSTSSSPAACITRYRCYGSCSSSLCVGVVVTTVGTLAAMVSANVDSTQHFIYCISSALAAAFSRAQQTRASP